MRTFQIGYALLALYAIPMWLLIDGGGIGPFFLAALLLTIPLGLSYGPQAALCAEMFPARVRHSGVSVSYALGSILGGAFAATIAQWLVASYGQSWLIGAYVAVLALVSLAAVTAVGRRTSNGMAPGAFAERTVEPLSHSCNTDARTPHRGAYMPF